MEDQEKQTRAKQICADDRKRFRRLHDEEWERTKVKRLCSRLPPNITRENEEVLERDLEEQDEQRAEPARIVGDRMLANQRVYQEQELVTDGQLLERRRAQEERLAEEQRAKAARFVEDRILANQRAQQEQKRLREERLVEKQRAREEQRARDAQIIERRKLARRQLWREQQLKDEQLLETYRLAKLRNRELRTLPDQENEQRRRIARAWDDSMAGALLQYEVSKV